jgi:hypothetical protein
VLRPETDDDNDFVDASLVFHVGDVVPSPKDDGEDVNEGVQMKRWEERVKEDGRNVRVHGFGV